MLSYSVKGRITGIGLRILSNQFDVMTWVGRPGHILDDF